MHADFAPFRIFSRIDTFAPFSLFRVGSYCKRFNLFLRAVAFTPTLLGNAIDSGLTAQHSEAEAQGHRSNLIFFLAILPVIT